MSERSWLCFVAGDDRAAFARGEVPPAVQERCSRMLAMKAAEDAARACGSERRAYVESLGDPITLGAPCFAATELLPFAGVWDHGACPECGGVTEHNGGWATCGMCDWSLETTSGWTLRSAPDDDEVSPRAGRGEAPIPPASTDPIRRDNRTALASARGATS